MFVFGRLTTLFGISLENITTCSRTTKVNLHDAVQKGLSEGVVKPLRKATFSSNSEDQALM